LYGTAAHAPSFGGSSSMGHWTPSGSPMPFASHASSHAYTSAMAAPPRGMGGMGTTSSFVPRGPVPPALAPRAAYPSTSFAAPHHAAAARPARAALAPRGVVPRCDAASTAGPADKNVSGQARSAGVSASSRLAAEQPPPPAPMAARASALLPLQPRAGAPPTPMRSTAMYMPPPQPGFPKTAAEGTYACVACDRGFDSRRDLSLHQSTHTQCPVPGCPFSASQKALQAHLSRDHRPARRDGSSAAARGGTTGDEEDEESAAYNAGVRMPPSLLEIIPPKYRGAWQVGDSDADIQRWRQERRKNFPSAAKVQEKEAASVIAVARGVLGAEPAPVSGSSDASAAPSLAAATPPTNVNDGVEAGTVDAQPPAHDDCANEGLDTRLGIMLGEDGVDAGEALAAVGPTADANDRFAAPMRGVCRMFLQGRCRRGRY
ncbi:nuclear fragile X mental retardation-interacting protein 1, partial [archaeon]